MMMGCARLMAGMARSMSAAIAAAQRSDDYHHID